MLFLLLLSLLECRVLPSGIFIFPVCPKLVAVVESTLAVCDDVRRGNGLATGPGHTSGQVQISFFMSGKIVAAATLAVVPACCCYYFAQFTPLPPRLWQRTFSKMPASRARSEQRERRRVARQGHGHSTWSSSRHWRRRTFWTTPKVDYDYDASDDDDGVQVRRPGHITMQALPGSLATFSTISTFYLATPKVSTALQRRRWLGKRENSRGGTGC